MSRTLQPFRNIALAAFFGLGQPALAATPTAAPQPVHPQTGIQEGDTYEVVPMPIDDPERSYKRVVAEIKIGAFKLGEMLGKLEQAKIDNQNPAPHQVNLKTAVTEMQKLLNEYLDYDVEARKLLTEKLEEDGILGEKTARTLIVASYRQGFESLFLSTVGGGDRENEMKALRKKLAEVNPDRYVAGLRAFGEDQRDATTQKAFNECVGQYSVRFPLPTIERELGKLTADRSYKSGLMPLDCRPLLSSLPPSRAQQAQTDYLTWLRAIMPKDKPDGNGGFKHCAKGGINPSTGRPGCLEWNI